MGWGGDVVCVGCGGMGGGDVWSLGGVMGDLGVCARVLRCGNCRVIGG